MRTLLYDPLSFEQSGVFSGAQPSGLSGFLWLLCFLVRDLEAFRPLLSGSEFKYSFCIIVRIKFQMDDYIRSFAVEREWYGSIIKPPLPLQPGLEILRRNHEHEIEPRESCKFTENRNILAKVFLQPFRPLVSCKVTSSIQRPFPLYLTICQAYSGFGFCFLELTLFVLISHIPYSTETSCLEPVSSTETPPLRSSLFPCFMLGTLWLLLLNRSRNKFTNSSENYVTSLMRRSNEWPIFSPVVHLSLLHWVSRREIVTFMHFRHVGSNQVFACIY